jgi:hypothetical protein
LLTADIFINSSHFVELDIWNALIARLEVWYHFDTKPLFLVYSYCTISNSISFHHTRFSFAHLEQNVKFYFLSDVLPPPTLISATTYTRLEAGGVRHQTPENTTDNSACI